MVKRTYKITDMHCSSCAISIDFDLEDIDGVKEAKTNFAKGELAVELDPNKVSDQVVVGVVKKSGYSAVPN